MLGVSSRSRKVLAMFLVVNMLLLSVGNGYCVGEIGSKVAHANQYFFKDAQHVVPHMSAHENQNAVGVNSTGDSTGDSTGEVHFNVFNNLACQNTLSPSSVLWGADAVYYSIAASVGDSNTHKSFAYNTGNCSNLYNGVSCNGVELADATLYKNQYITMMVKVMNQPTWLTSFIESFTSWINANLVQLIKGLVEALVAAAAVYVSGGTAALVLAPLEEQIVEDLKSAGEYLAANTNNSNQVIGTFQVAAFYDGANLTVVSVPVVDNSVYSTQDVGVDGTIGHMDQMWFRNSSGSTTSQYFMWSYYTVVSQEVDWVTNPSNNHQYKMIACSTWGGCEAAAATQGANLATVRSKAENDWIVKTFGLVNMWIGLNSQATQDKWVWVSGETSSYTDWGSGEPNYTSTDRCANIDVSYDGTGQWDNTACNNTQVTEAVIESISKPQISITAPKDSEVLTGGSTYTIKWTESNLTAGNNLTVLFNPGTTGSVWGYVKQNLPVTTQSYDWAVPNDADLPNAQVYVCSGNYPFETCDSKTISIKKSTNTSSSFWTGNGSLISYHGRLLSLGAGVDYPYAITQDVTMAQSSTGLPIGFFQWQVNTNGCSSLKIDTSTSEKNVDITLGTWSTRDTDITFSNVTLPAVISNPSGVKDGDWYVVMVAFKNKVSSSGRVDVKCTTEAITSSSPTAASSNAGALYDGSYKWNGNASVISHMYRGLTGKSVTSIDWPFGVFKDITKVSPSSYKPVVFFQWQVWNSGCNKLTLDAPSLSSSEKNATITVKNWDSTGSVEYASKQLPFTIDASSESDGTWKIIEVKFLNPVSTASEVRANCPGY
ncbi:MAG: C-type lectin domain-containing protein [Nitrospirae bacterium]|nr:C-type lectin domain-containing protein [Nitrospirota bacterium]